MDSEQDIGVEEAHGTAYAGAGARLRAARETRGFDLPHIAAESRIPLRHLEAIEAGDFGSLPSRTYAIGFSRTYARLLGLDDAAIVDAVRGELSDGQTRRTSMGSGMEPGDPAKLPSAGLAWFGAFAALVLAVGLIAFFSSRFGAGNGPGPIETPPPPAAMPVAANPAPAPAAAAPAADGEVVLTSLGDGVWVRIYEEGGERLLEKQLAMDESFTLPTDAVDPRINTGRPDLLAITIDGESVPPLAQRPTTLAGMAISASALLARPTPETEAAAPAASGAGADG
ncbi:RodZ domain-containing protein [Erythrobacter sp.]|uniref:RodZ domain-containing protein n=1 Tax=Erythrobacter sp. TaxID=1042 RepID=UPI0025F9C249|nr:RodZ domain-containing protein [Erythrobacter sp.]